MMELIVRGQDGLSKSIPVASVTWKGAKYRAPRSLEVTLPCTTKGLHQCYEPREGEAVVFRWKEQELFRGHLFARSRTKDGTLSFTAHDHLIYFLKNSATYVFKAKKASEILLRICSDYQIPIGTITDTEYKIPARVYDGKMLYDIVMEALDLTYRQTGVRYYLSSEAGKITLVKRAESVRKWIIEDGINLVDYNYQSSLENTITRVKLEAGQGQQTIIATAQDHELAQKFGILQHYEKVSEKMNQAQLQQKAKQILTNKGLVEKSFGINALGIPDVVSGRAIYVICQDLGIKKGYYIDEDTHQFQGNEHTMSLKLTETEELPEIDQNK